MKRIIFSLLLIVLSLGLKAQKPLPNYTWYDWYGKNRFFGPLRLPLDTLPTADTGSIAYKNGTLYIKDTTGVFVRMAKFSEAGSGSSADSTLFATLYRLDTMRANLYQRLGLKLDISDTSSMLTNYVRAKRLSDTASAIRSAFPKFGTSTDNLATESRVMDMNSNMFILKGVNTLGGIYTNGVTPFDEDANAGSYLEFFQGGPPSTMDVKMGAKFNANIKGYLSIIPNYDSTIYVGAQSSKNGKTSALTITPENFYIYTSSGALYIDTLNSQNLTADSLIVWNKTSGSLGIISKSAFLSSAGGVPNTRTLTINGTTYDLSANRSWTVSTGDFYSADGTFSGNRRANLDGYRLTFDSGQVRYRDTMTSSTGKLYGMISDYGRAGIEHINYDSLTTAYHSVNTVTGVKFGVKDQNNLDTNNYIQADASGAYAVTGAVSTADSSNKIATTKWVKQLGLSGGSVTNIYNSDGTISGNRTIDADGYDITINSANHVAIGADSIQLALNQGVLRFSGLNAGGQPSDSVMSIDAYGLIRKRYLQNATSTKDGLMSKEDKARLDSNSFLVNPVHPDSILAQKNDTVMVAKAVTVESQLPDITINTVRTDTTLKHQLVKLNISEPIISFSAGAGFAADTTVFTDSTLYGSFYTGQDSFYVTKAFAVIKGQSGDTLGIQVVYNDTFNVTGTVVGGGTLAVNNRTTGNSFDISTNSGIPPNVWVWLKSPTVVAGKKPEYLSVTLIGYRKYIAP